MSVKLFSLFVKTLRQNIPRNPCRTGLQYRHITAVEMASVDSNADNKQEPEIVINKNQTRFKRRCKRKWDEPNPNKEIGESDSKIPFERIKRKKMAMLLGYSGVNYYGMQRNPGVPTIEEDLLKALLEAKYIKEEDFTNQQNAQFQRSSRTDKGVSAARQVVSLKLPLEVDIEEINKRLPDCIKVFGIKRVTNKFNSKSKCNARTYSYTLPTYVFEPSLVTEEERKQYRISAEKLQKVNEILGIYKGTKSYHNFTEKKHHQDPSSLRYMMGFNVERVFVHSDMEFAVLLVKGQSFMLHQIRKMVGLMIAVLRGMADASIVDRAFGKEKVMIPTAPGLGLVLDKVHYERYDAKFKDSHDSLSWDEVEPSVQEFKQSHIYPSIVEGEIAGNMGYWLEKLAVHSFEPSDDRPEVDAGEKSVADDDDDDDDQHDVSEEANVVANNDSDDITVVDNVKPVVVSNTSDVIANSDVISGSDVSSSDVINSSNVTCHDESSEVKSSV